MPCLGLWIGSFVAHNYYSLKDLIPLRMCIPSISRVICIFSMSIIKVAIGTPFSPSISVGSLLMTAIKGYTWTMQSLYYTMFGVHSKQVWGISETRDRKLSRKCAIADCPCKTSSGEISWWSTSVLLAFIYRAFQRRPSPHVSSFASWCPRYRNITTHK